MNEVLHKVIRDDDGWDWDDLRSAFEENSSDELSLRHVLGILAEIPGENDELNWHWIVKLTDGRYAYIQGWCDYTGWDCQSGIDYEFATTALKAAKESPIQEEYSSRAIQAQLIAQLKGTQPYATYEENNRVILSYEEENSS